MKAKLTVTNFLGFTLKELKITIIDTQFLFEDKKKIIAQRIINANREKTFEFDLNKRNYIVQLESNKSVYQKLWEVPYGDIKVKLPAFFTKFKKDLSYSQSDIEDIAEKNRWDKEKCFICKKKHKGIDKFKCHYCNYCFCEKHRLPENHKCKGNPTLPPSMRLNPQSWTFWKST